MKLFVLLFRQFLSRISVTTSAVRGFKVLGHTSVTANVTRTDISSKPVQVHRQKEGESPEVDDRMLTMATCVSERASW